VTRRPTPARGRKSTPSTRRAGKGRAAPRPADVDSSGRVPLLTANVVHCMKGRLRVKLPVKKGDSAFFASVAERLAKCPGVEKVEVNPITGSVLFVHSATPQQIDRFAASKGLFRLAPWRTAHKTLFGDVADLFTKWNRDLKQATVGGVDIPSLIFLSLVASGIYQVFRGNLSMPAWYTAFYYALGIFSRGHVEEPDEGQDLLQDAEEVADVLDDLSDGGDD
jgi:hypothetical protein